MINDPETTAPMVDGKLFIGLQTDGISHDDQGRILYWNHATSVLTSTTRKSGDVGTLISD